MTPTTPTARTAAPMLRAPESIATAVDGLPATAAAEIDSDRTPPRLLVIVTIAIIVLGIGGYLLWRNTLGADPGGLPGPAGEPARARGQAAGPA